MPLSRITSASIDNSAISAADIADGTITAAKIISVANTQITGNIVSSQIAPDQTLNGNVSVTGNLTTTGNTILGDASTDTLTVGVTGIVKDASGNVGIGNTNNSALLHVGKVNENGDVAVMIGNGATSSFTTSTATLQFRQGGNGGATQNAGKIVSGRTGNYSSGADSDSFLSFYTALDNTDTERMRIDSSGNLLFNSGYGSVATAYGCRAWVNFNGGGTPAIRASGNVSSITDNGVGDYTVIFATAMVDANYSVAGIVGGADTPAANAGIIHVKLTSGLTTGSVRFYCTNISAAAADRDYILINVHR